jgi:colanic acid biosynthesis glycosyl transferase WcaI
MPRNRTILPLRLLAWTAFHFTSTLAGIFLGGKPDVVVSPSPPLTIGLSARFLAWYHRVRYIYDVQELYPDVAINLGKISNKWLIRLLLGVERYIYQKATAIKVIAPGMRQRLLEKGVPSEKIAVIPNFVDVSDLRPLPKDNEFSRAHGIHEKFVISYSGNLGPAQGLEVFVEAAQLLREEPEIHFMMMGSGILEQALRQRVADLALNNFSFLPYQHISLMPQIYAASDICLVPQTAGIGSDAVPSKVYRIMASGRPVLACSDADSDLADLVNAAECGMIVQPGCAQSLAAVIRQAYQSQQVGRRMGEAGREHVIEHYARPVVTNRYNDLIQSVVNGNC